MGITSSFGALRLRAKNRGADFSDVVTLGRPTPKIPRRELARMLSRAGNAGTDAARVAASGYADEFLHAALSAKSVSAIDYSGYQKADIVHDLNLPVPNHLHRRFSAVIDGGTLEDVFDVRQVLANYMNMVRIGGSIFLNVPGNNLLGHGFYQFSPELFYRVFSQDNGSVTREVSVIESPFSTVEASPRQRCFHTVDPREAGKRVRLVNSRPLTLFVHAQRTEDKALLQHSPMQSDYVSTRDQHKRPQRDADRRGKGARTDGVRMFGTGCLPGVWAGAAPLPCAETQAFTAKQAFFPEI